MQVKSRNAHAAPFRAVLELFCSSKGPPTGPRFEQCVSTRNQKTNLFKVAMRFLCETSGSYVDIGGVLASEHSGLIHGMEVQEDQVILITCSIPIESEVLQCIKRYCESPGPPFLIELSDKQLVQLLVASDFLLLHGLLDLACKQLGTVLDACTVEEIRTRFQIPDDMPENEARALDADDEWLVEAPATEPAGRLSHAAREIYAASDEKADQLIEGLPDIVGRGMTENTQAALERVRDGADQAGDGTCALSTVRVPMGVRMRRTFNAR